MVYYNNYRGLFFYRATKKLHALIIKQNRTKQKNGIKVSGLQFPKNENKKLSKNYIRIYTITPKKTYNTIQYSYK